MAGGSFCALLSLSLEKPLGWGVSWAATQGCLGCQREAGCVPEPLGQRSHALCLCFTRLSTIVTLVRLLPCFNNTFLNFCNLPGSLPISAVINEEYVCVTVLDRPNPDSHKHKSLSRSRCCQNCTVEEPGAKLSLMLKEKFALFPANHAESLPQETQFNSHNLISFALVLFAQLKMYKKSRRRRGKKC